MFTFNLHKVGDQVFSYLMMTLQSWQNILKVPQSDDRAIYQLLIVLASVTK